MPPDPSLPAVIATLNSVLRERMGETKRPNPTPGTMELERVAFNKAVRVLEWTQDNAVALREFIAWRKERGE